MARLAENLVMPAIAAQVVVPRPAEYRVRPFAPLGEVVPGPGQDLVAALVALHPVVAAARVDEIVPGPAPDLIAAVGAVNPVGGHGARDIFRCGEAVGGAVQHVFDHDHLERFQGHVDDGGIAQIARRQRVGFGKPPRLVPMGRVVDERYALAGHRRKPRHIGRHVQLDILCRRVARRDEDDEAVGAAVAVHLDRLDRRIRGAEPVVQHLQPDGVFRHQPERLPARGQLVAIGPIAVGVAAREIDRAVQFDGPDIRAAGPHSHQPFEHLQHDARRFQPPLLARFPRNAPFRHGDVQHPVARRIEGRAPLTDIPLHFAEVTVGLFRRGVADVQGVGRFDEIVVLDQPVDRHLRRVGEFGQHVDVGLRNLCGPVHPVAVIDPAQFEIAAPLLAGLDEDCGLIGPRPQNPIQSGLRCNRHGIREDAVFLRGHPIHGAPVFVPDLEPVDHRFGVTRDEVRDELPDLGHRHHVEPARRLPHGVAHEQMARGQHDGRRPALSGGPVEKGVQPDEAVGVGHMGGQRVGIVIERGPPLFRHRPAGIAQAGDSKLIDRLHEAAVRVERVERIKRVAAEQLWPHRQARRRLMGEFELHGSPGPQTSIPSQCDETAIICPQTRLVLTLFLPHFPTSDLETDCADPSGPPPRHHAPMCFAGCFAAGCGWPSSRQGKGGSASKSRPPTI